MPTRIMPNALRTTPYHRWSASAALNTVVPPASNIAGIVVGPGYLHTQGGGTYARLMAKASAPASIDDATALTLHAHAANDVYSKSWDGFLIVPPGLGLYEQNSSAAGNSGCDFGYEVLT